MKCHRWRRGLPDMEGRCQYIQYTFIDVWQRVVLQLLGWERG